MESISKLIYFNALKCESDPFLTLSATSYGKNFFLSARSARFTLFSCYWSILSDFSENYHRFRQRSADLRGSSRNK